MTAAAVVPRSNRTVTDVDLLAEGGDTSSSDSEDQNDLSLTGGDSDNSKAADDTSQQENDQEESDHQDSDSHISLSLSDEHLSDGDDVRDK